jgi:hypothetical protein
VPELNVPVDQREQCVIAANANVIAGANLRTALAHDNAASRDKLPIIAFHAKHLRVAVSTVARATHTFFMCHD